MYKAFLSSGLVALLCIITLSSHADPSPTTSNPIVTQPANSPAGASNNHQPGTAANAPDGLHQKKEDKKQDNLESPPSESGALPGHLEQYNVTQEHLEDYVNRPGQLSPAWEPKNQNGHTLKIALLTDRAKKIYIPRVALIKRISSDIQPAKMDDIDVQTQGLHIHGKIMKAPPFKNSQNVIILLNPSELIQLDSKYEALQPKGKVVAELFINNEQPINLSLQDYNDLVELKNKLVSLAHTG
jgi:hypothetical protein